MFLKAAVFSLIFWILKNYVYVTMFLFLSGLLQDVLLYFILSVWFPYHDTFKTSGNKNIWAVITGADSGLGRSYALQLARKGINICIVNREPKENRPIDEELKKLGVRVKRIVFNFNETNNEKYKDQAKHLNQELESILPQVQILINNVGTMGNANYSNVMQPLFSHDFDKASHNAFQEDMIQINQNSVLLFTSLIVPTFIEKRRGILINVGSLLSYDAIWGSAMYCATKAFVLSYTQALRQELKEYNIMVQAVTPSFVDTKFLSPPLRRLLPSFINVNPDLVALGSLNLLGWKPVCHGCFSHSVQNRLLIVLTALCPIWLHDIIIRFVTDHFSDIARNRQSFNFTLKKHE